MSQISGTPIPTRLRRRDARRRKWRSSEVVVTLEVIDRVQVVLFRHGSTAGRRRDVGTEHVGLRRGTRLGGKRRPAWIGSSPGNFRPSGSGTPSPRRAPSHLPARPPRLRRSGRFRPLTRDPSRGAGPSRVVFSHPLYPACYYGPRERDASY